MGVADRGGRSQFYASREWRGGRPPTLLPYLNYGSSSREDSNAGWANR